MSVLFGFLGNIDPIRVAVVFGVLYFIDYALKPTHKLEINDKVMQDVPELDHMDPSKAPTIREVDEDGKAESTI